MWKKCGIASVILIICVIALGNMWKKPKIVNCIKTIDTTYLTILANDPLFKEKDALAREIVEMCKENAFKNIKLSVEPENELSNLHIIVYQNKESMADGKIWLTIRYNISEEQMKVL